MRLVVIGREGQVARALAERAPSLGTSAVFLGRPQIDLADPLDVEEFLVETSGDLIVNAAAYTAVDQAEAEPDLANAINGIGAGIVARAAVALGVPIIHLSTDYVFDGTAEHPYRESDVPNPVGVYGASKLLGEHAVASETANHVILRTAWIYSPFGRNFVKTMLQLALERNEVAVVADQYGSPTSALELADAIIAVGRNLLARPDEPDLRGVFHMTGSGFTSWAEFAREIFNHSARLGGPTAQVRAIASADYPTAARRPANSRLDCSKLADIHNVALPVWRTSLKPCVKRLIDEAWPQEIQP